MNPDTPPVRLIAVIMDLSGGPLAWEFSHRHFGEGWPLREIVDVYGGEYSKSQVHRMVNRCWSILERHGLLPDHWHKQARGGQRRIKAHGCDGDMYQGRTDRRHNGGTMV